MTDKRSINPMAWIPTLYIAEGLPYFAVNVLAVILYTRMGVGLKEMAFWTGALYLPWVIKPFWSPMVDITATKRRWILTMQISVAVALACVALALQTSAFFVLSLSAFWIMAFLSSTHDIAADGFYMLALSSHEQATYVGVRNTFYRVGSIIGQGGLVMLAGWLEFRLDSIPMAWSLTFFILSISFLGIFLYHSKLLPSPEADVKRSNTSPRDITANFGHTFSTFIRKPYLLSAVAFMLFYRFGEALMLKVATPFLISPTSEGGLGLSTAEVGLVNGTVGVICLLAGGILGGLCIARGGLRKWLWPMALALTLPCAVYCWLAHSQPNSLLLINVAIGFEQFGYGFGFTAFMLYLIYFCQGEYKTSHYAFCTAIMALGMMLPGMAAGWIFESLDTGLTIPGLSGYEKYFWLVMILNSFTYAVCALVKINPSYGKKLQN